jgi:hypothetical protein
MEKFEQLTKVQQGLVKDLISEFTKINPKPINGASRFTFDTINDCMKEEERFIETILKHNKTMVKVFSDQLKADIKEFEKEFGKALRIEVGYAHSNGNEYHTIEKLVEGGNTISGNGGSFGEAHLFIVSRTKKCRKDSRYDYFGNEYHTIYVKFKREKVEITLDSGKKVYGYKIIGLTYKTHDWLNEDKEYCKKYSTLDEMVQTNKDVQQNIVSLAV